MWIWLVVDVVDLNQSCLKTGESYERHTNLIE